MEEYEIIIEYRGERKILKIKEDYSFHPL